MKTNGTRQLEANGHERFGFEARRVRQDGHAGSDVARISKPSIAYRLQPLIQPRPVATMAVAMGDDAPFDVLRRFQSISRLAPTEYRQQTKSAAGLEGQDLACGYRAKRIPLRVQFQ